MLTVDVCTKLESLLLFSGLFFKVEVSPELCILFKTVSHREERALELQTGLSLEDVINLASSEEVEKISQYHKVQRYASLYLARATIFINDHNLLLDRKNTLPQLQDYYKTLPVELLFLLFMESLKRRSEEVKLVPYLENFHRLGFARLLWSSIKRCGFNSYQLTGLLGSEHFCVSHIQLLFMNYMERQDRLENQRDLFRPFQFISGLFSKDAHKKVDEYFNSVELEFVSKENKDLYVQGVTTKEELVDQLDRMMRGEEDDADKVIKKTERHSYETWKRDYLSTRKRLDDSDIPILGKKDVEITEEFLVKEYLRQRNFKFSSWLLDEINIPEE